MRIKLTSHGAGAAHRGPGSARDRQARAHRPRALAVRCGRHRHGNLFAARSSSAVDATAIVVAEVYTLLIVALMIVFPPARGTGAGAGPLSQRRRRPGIRRVRGCVPRERRRFNRPVGPWPWSSSIAILKAMGSDDGRLADSGAGRWPAIIVIRASLLAALGEETLFRGVLYTWLRQRLPASGCDSRLCREHMRRFMASPRFFRSRSSWGSASGRVRERSGSIGANGHRSRGPQCRAYRVGVLRQRVDGAAAGCGEAHELLEGDDAAATKHDSQEQSRDYRDDDRTEAP